MVKFPSVAVPVTPAPLPILTQWVPNSAMTAELPFGSVVDPGGSLVLAGQPASAPINEVI